jgi:predicted ATP-dependent endonuclease of OLD family
MKISRIQIQNFKSIEDITIDLKSYGQDENESSTSIFVGVNESGKSNILEAMNALNQGFSDYSFEDSMYKHGSQPIKYIDVYYVFSLDTLEEIKVKVKEIGIPDEIYDLIDFEKVAYNVFIGKTRNGEFFDTEIKSLFYNWHHYYRINNEIMKFPFNEILEKDFSFDMAKSQLPESAELLSKLELENHISFNIEDYCRAFLPKIIYWKSSPEHLITESIDLIEFEKNNSLSIPLKHIFAIYGAETSEKISENINRALKDDVFKSELDEELSYVVTKHVNSIWKDHKIAFKIKIDGSQCKVQVEDISAKRKFYKMSNRSDGFKQFVSLMLSLSAQNNTDQLKNAIILLDEPEVHLHPSGIRYMRDEILRIGKNNYVFVSTHSHYFIDTETPERHFIVEKNQKTTLKQLDDNSNFSNDEVTARAFGISLYKELLPQHIFLVEGEGDRIVFNTVFKHYIPNSQFTVKGAGGCSKIQNIATLLVNESINSIILVDADNEGKIVKGSVMKAFRDFYSKKNVFTLKDVLSDLPDGSTLEDLFPSDFNKSFCQNKLGLGAVIDNDKPFIAQLINLHPPLKNKDFQEEFKMELSNSFIVEFNSKEKIINCAERFHRFCLALTAKMDSLKPVG